MFWFFLVAVIAAVAVAVVATRRGPGNACAEGSQRVADCDPSA